jgi:hypothetical protein
LGKGNRPNSFRNFKKWDKEYDKVKKTKDFSENAEVTKKNNKTIYKY